MNFNLMNFAQSLYKSLQRWSIKTISKMVSAANFTNKVERDDDIGKALSEEHAMRRWEHQGIKPVANKEQRLKAVGTENDFPEDAMSIYMTKYSEQIFEPKRILDSGDWLATYREPDQRFEYYKQGKGNIQWLGPMKNKVYLFIAD